MKFTLANSMLLASFLIPGVVSSPHPQQPGKKFPLSAAWPRVMPEPRKALPSLGSQVMILNRPRLQEVLVKGNLPPPSVLPRAIPSSRVHQCTSTSTTTFIASTTSTSSNATTVPTSDPNDPIVPRDVCDGNTASMRSEWCDYSIDTDYTSTSPDTGVTREYWFELTDVTVSPDGVCESNFLQSTFSREGTY
jgi:hypothetical protein